MRPVVSIVLLALLVGAPSTLADDHAASGTLIVLNKSDDDADFLDPETGKILLTLPTGAGPHEVAVSPDGRLAVVADYGSNATGFFSNGHTLTVYDLTDGTLARTIELDKYERPHGIQFIDDTTLVATSEIQGSVVVVDAAAGEVLGAIPTDARGSHMLVAAPDGKRVYTANMQSNSVSVLDVEQRECLATVATGSECEGIDITPDGRYVWATNRGADTISIIDTETLDVVDTLACGSFPIRVKVTPDGSRALVSNAQSAELVVFDVAERKEIKRIPMDTDARDDAGERLFGELMQGSAAPIGILVTPDGRRAFVANTNADVVTVIDLETLEIIGGFRAGRQPDGLGWGPPLPADA